MKLPVNRNLPLLALTLLAACGGGGVQSVPAVHPSATGPAADYPMVLGQPFVVDGVTYTPADVMNYDAVGYAAVGAVGGAGVTAAHRTLPLPSYVEVTSLETGRTILVRLERRGPMSGNQLIELSPGAAAQLGLAGGTNAPVRVRRVNPPEQERAMLRMGQPAPARMDTPKSLLTVLNRRLEQQPGMISGNAPKSLPQPEAQPAPLPVPQAVTSAPAKPGPAKPEPAKPEPAKPEPAKPAPAPKPKPVAPAPAAKGSLVVQVGAFSDKARADAVAAKVGGSVSAAGKVWRVRVGPFQTQAQAEAALAKVRAAGYTEARIQRAQ
ncbi:septal ring lytic transglycosylase RlpA family protein [Novosphingobium sp.]|uniref:septal ring lytic transglycosylase RlpA family protein n=1 Tax=Novosphingobium sp. TaxID=1874826 RepID=UPI0035B1E9B0